ncbi:hypothetical protein TCDM_12611 [Trypanosoma cruzi Dm28c]|uniref:Uncharacterized protein n=1 Tax=Trypanosoma cruzi Dm28c TaxID=1416333 RepID=V5AUT6_TRYCR|nr:hypothetical protein TCDM_12611 [Trypanosoma cruzi Dm28c]
MQEEKTSTISPSSFHSPREMAKAAATTPATRSMRTLIHPSRGTKFPAIPPSMGHGAQLNAVTRGASHPQENRLGVRSLSLLLMATEEDNSRHTQLPACTTKGAFKSTAMCTLCVCVCVPAETQSKDVEKEAEYVERSTKCTAEARGRSNNKKTAQTHDCTAFQAAVIHTIFIENTKTLSPSTYTNPITQNNYK